MNNAFLSILPKLKGLYLIYVQHSSCFCFVLFCWNKTFSNCFQNLGNWFIFSSIFVRLWSVDVEWFQRPSKYFFFFEIQLRWGGSMLSLSYRFHLDRKFEDTLGETQICAQWCSIQFIDIHINKYHTTEEMNRIMILHKF